MREEYGSAADQKRNQEPPNYVSFFAVTKDTRIIIGLTCVASGRDEISRHCALKGRQQASWPSLMSFIEVSGSFQRAAGIRNGTPTRPEAASVGALVHTKRAPLVPRNRLTNPRNARCSRNDGASYRVIRPWRRRDCRFTPPICCFIRAQRNRFQPSLRAVYLRSLAD